MGGKVVDNIFAMGAFQDNGLAWDMSLNGFFPSLRNAHHE
jgi:hypothetical protein